MKEAETVWIVERYSEPEARWIPVGVRETRQKARIEANTWRNQRMRIWQFVRGKGER